MTASFLATLAPLCILSGSSTCSPAEISRREGHWGLEEMRVTSHMTDITPAGVTRRRAARSWGPTRREGPRRRRATPSADRTSAPPEDRPARSRRTRVRRDGHAGPPRGRSLTTLAPWSI
ncbi:hypothetical protein GCM10010392_06960 [Streptomyces clavifer]|nr:hypothetical protein GCM10010392_06960 [Streptomyces clavifer]